VLTITISPRLQHLALLGRAEFAAYPTRWVAVYNTGRFMETGDVSYELAGSGPLIIDRFSGAIHKGVLVPPLRPELPPSARLCPSWGLPPRGRGRIAATAGQTSQRSSVASRHAQLPARLGN
jgi:hypothetical protein